MSESPSHVPSRPSAPRGHGFGTAPVFLAGISTILGAVMFLRFGYAVGHVGLLGSLAIILIGHLVTIPTALAIAEIATNRRVEGGGEYYIISRSFGTDIGSVIGISLYLSQAVSVAFYMIAFAEAFQPLAPQFTELTGLPFDPRMLSIPATLGLVALMLTKGADLGVKALYLVAAVLGLSLILFFAGTPVAGVELGAIPLTGGIEDPDAFFIVFAICFPAFTGMTAGVGLSGDLADPRRSIPRGTIAATLVGMLVYLAIAVKLAASAPADMLATDQLVMGRIALWGPIIPIGLACATISSAIGSILVAPRTLQALGGDASVPLGPANAWLARGVGASNEPRNATLVTSALALIVVAAGSVDLVARLISMFFMVTYGALCAISFLEHFAARPSYRPSFRSRWYISLFGAVTCLFMMFQMDPVFAALSLLIMGGLYRWMSRRSGRERSDLEAMFRGVVSQLTRYMNIRLQGQAGSGEWRPSILMVNERTFDRRAPIELLSWLSHRYGFGTYIHFIRGQLNKDTASVAESTRLKLVREMRSLQTPVYVDTIVSPSSLSAIAQGLQMPGVSGLENNCLFFEVSKHDDEATCREVAANARFCAEANKSLMILRHGDHHFGNRRTVHVWLTWNDGRNANLMVLLGYILLGHPDWSEAEISVFAALPADDLDERREEFEAAMTEGRIPISQTNIKFLRVGSREAFLDAVTTHSSEADLVIMGFSLASLEERGHRLMDLHPDVRDVLIVHTPQHIAIE